eukprot:6172099-Pleurochrysis_carterae.AAC.2
MPCMSAFVLMSGYVITRVCEKLIACERVRATGCPRACACACARKQVAAPTHKRDCAKSAGELVLECACVRERECARVCLCVPERVSKKRCRSPPRHLKRRRLR